MVNLEALGSLVVSGNPDEADSVVRALGLELSSSFWIGQFSVAVVGFGSELERFQGVRSYPEVAELLHTLYRRRLRRRAAALQRKFPRSPTPVRSKTRIDGRPSR